MEGGEATPTLCLAFADPSVDLLIRSRRDQTMDVSGTGTKKYRAIERHYATLVDTLGKTVDPAHFARRLKEKSLISQGVYYTKWVGPFKLIIVL